LGFGTDGSWLPQPRTWSALAASVQARDPSSMLSLYQSALALRRAEPALLADSFAWLPSPGGVLRFVRGQGGSAVEVVVNMSDAAVDVPAGDVLLASEDLADGRLAAGAAVWLRPPV
jgi:alpha-glucosidase